MSKRHITGLEANHLIIDAVGCGWPSATEANVSNNGKDIVILFEGEWEVPVNGKDEKIAYSLQLNLHDCADRDGMRQVMPGLMIMLVTGEEKPKPKRDYQQIHVRLSLEVPNYGGIIVSRIYGSVDEMLKNLKNDLGMMSRGMGCVNLLPTIVSNYFNDKKEAAALGK